MTSATNANALLLDLVINNVLFVVGLLGALYVAIHYIATIPRSDTSATLALLGYALLYVVWVIYRARRFLTSGVRMAYAFESSFILYLLLLPLAAEVFSNPQQYTMFAFLIMLILITIGGTYFVGPREQRQQPT